MLIPDRVIDRFWSRVDIGEESACWLFTMSVGSHGYGQIGWQDEGVRRCALAHRIAWQLTYGEIPDGLTIDHRCRIRRCCNPSHLRLLSNLENARDNGFATRTHCPARHEYTKENTVIQTSKAGKRSRVCLRCRRRRDSERRARARAAA